MKGLAASQKIFVQVSPILRDKLKPQIDNFLGKTVDIQIHGSFILASTASGGILEIVSQEFDFSIEQGGKHRSMASNDTLRGIERFIFFAQYNREPKDEELEFIHEAILETSGLKHFNPILEKEFPLRSHLMNSKQFAKLIDDALTLLLGLDIPDEVYSVIGKDMKTLWRAWYDWRYNRHSGDPLAELEPETWKGYQRKHPVCELCAVGPLPNDPLERSHIVSAGADGADYEANWNWLHVHHSHHMNQHQQGWEKAIIAKYPHIEGKIKTARIMANGRK
jgi:hypothetical protein